MVQRYFGQEEMAQRMISFLFPEGGNKIDLTTEWMNHGKAQLPESDRTYGSALYDGKNTAVLHYSKEGEAEGIELNRKVWKYFGYDNSAEILLSLDQLPKKTDVIAAFANTDFDIDLVVWNDVIDAARERGVTPDEVLKFVMNQKLSGV